MKRGIYLITFIFIIISINPISSFNFQNTTSTQGQEFNFGGSVTTINLFGNITNFSQLADSNTGNIPPSNGEGLTWSSPIMKWVATVLDGDLIWGRNTGTATIFPLNDSNLDMSDGGGNVTATFFFGNMSKAIGLDNRFLFRNGSNSEPLLNLSEDLAAQDIFVTRINTSGEVRIDGRLITGGEPGNVGVLGQSGIGAGGPIVANDTITIFARPNSISLIVTEASTFAQIIPRFTNSASFFADEKLLCDSNNPFTIDDKFKQVTLFNLTDFSAGFSAGISDFINSSCVVWSPQVRPDLSFGDISPTSYLISSGPTKVIYDNGAEISTHVGKNAKHVINFKNNSEEMLKVDAVGGEDNQILAQFTSDINGKLGFTNIRSFVESSKDVNDTITHNLVVETDLTNFNGGEYHGIEIDILNPNDTKATAIVIDSEFDNLVLVTRQEDASKIWLNDSSSLTNITNDVLDSQISTSIFPNNGSTLYIGNIINFTQISFGLDISSNVDIDLVGFFCNESGWFSLDTIDGTNGMQGTGSISFQTPETRGTCNFQINGDNFPAGENFTYIALQRTNPNVVITPNATLIELVVDSSIIKIGNADGVTGADNSFSFVNEELLGPGEPHTAFFYTDSSGATRVGSWFTSRANKTASGNSNSLIVAADNDLTDRLNLTETSNAVQRIENYYGETSPVDFDSSQNRTSLFVLFAGVMQQLHLSDGPGNGLLSVFGDVNFFLRAGSIFDVVGDMNLRKTTIVPTGFLIGETVILNPPTTDFENGILSPFVQISSGGGVAEWTVLSDTNCADGLCARALGGALSPPRIMEVNFSTQPFDNLNLTFNLTTINLDAGDTFNVTINNNSGSGEQEIFSIIDGADVVNAKINPAIPTNMNNVSVVSLRYYLTANVANEQAYVDLISLTGNATEDTTQDVDRGDASLFLGFDSDGISYEGPEVDGTGDLNVTADTINLNGNVTLNGGSLFWANETCTFITSPNGLGVLEVCNP